VYILLTKHRRFPSTPSKMSFACSLDVLIDTDITPLTCPNQRNGAGPAEEQSGQGRGEGQAIRPDAVDQPVHAGVRGARVRRHRRAAHRVRGASRSDLQKRILNKWEPSFTPRNPRSGLRLFRAGGRLNCPPCSIDSLTRFSRELVILGKDGRGEFIDSRTRFCSRELVPEETIRGTI
jgi:hypothetical protein